MKALLMILGVITSALMIFITENEEKKSIAKSVKFNDDIQNYTWNIVANPGSGSWPEKWEEGKWPMGIVPLLGFKGKLWMIGQNKSWSSENGINWSVELKTDWGERHGMTFVFFQNKLWMAGGMKNWGDFRNDIWTSPDGSKWERVAEHAPWSARVKLKIVVFKNKLWLIGGTVSSNNPGELPDKWLNDIWSSSDGITWRLELENAPWPARHDPKVIVFENKLWMLGGSDNVGDGGKNDIWNSSDGIHWHLIMNNASWPGRRNNGVLIYDDKLWVFGGVGKNDAWYSTDGIQWIRLSDQVQWSSRTTECSVVFKNKLWIYSGKTVREDSWSGDIWTLSKK